LFAFYVSSGVPATPYFAGLNISRDVAHWQAIVYVWIAVGLSVGVAGLPLKRQWVWLTAGSSLIYLVAWYRAGPMRFAGPLQGYELMWQIATQLDLYTSFFVRDLIIPAAFVVTLLAAVTHILRRALPQRGPDSAGASRPGAK
jgi:hypothetical protein